MQVLRGQCEVNYYQIRQTTVVIFFISAFSPPRLPFLLANILSNRFAPYILFSHKDFIKYLSSV